MPALNEAGQLVPSLTELGQGINPDNALIKNCPKCHRLNWSWTVCNHGPRVLDRPPTEDSNKKNK